MSKQEESEAEAKAKVESAESEAEAKPAKKSAKDDDEDAKPEKKSKKSAAKPAKKSKFGLIVGLIVAVVVIVLAGVLFWHFKDSSSITSSSKPVPAARAFNAHTVWVRYAGNASSIDKDQPISQILDFDGKGNVTVYNMPKQTKFSALRGMSDDAMIAYAKKMDRKNYDESKKSDLDRVNDEVKNNHYAKYKKEYDDKTYKTALEKDADSAESDYYYGFGFSGSSNGPMSAADRIAKNGDKLRKWYEDRLPAEKFELDLFNSVSNKIKAAEYRAPKPTKFTLKAETDGTGNNVSSETLVYDYEHYDSGSNLSYMLNYSSSKIYKAVSDGVSSADYFTQLEKKWADGNTISNSSRNKINDKRPLWERALYRLEREEVTLTPSDTLRQVYDMWFGGYDGLSLKVSEKSAGFMLDSANTKGIEIK